VSALALAFGPIVGGVLTQDINWSWIFFINIPVGVAGVLGALRFVPENASPRKVRLDALGIVLMAAASFCIIYPLVQGRELGWPLWTFGLMAAGVALLGLFVLAERRSHGSPLIEPGLLRNRAFSTGLLTGVVFFTAFGGLLMVFSMYTQLGLRFSPLHAGLTMAPMSLGAAIGAGSAYALMPKFGRGVLQAGLLLTLPATVALALVIDHNAGHTGSWDLAAPLLISGIGLGWVFGSMFPIILSGVQDHEVGSASGTLTAIQQLGNAGGVAILATIFFSVVDHGHTASTAIARTLLVAIGLYAASFAISFLLPRQARLDDVH
jgi:MFS family permease